MKMSFFKLKVLDMLAGRGYTLAAATVLMIFSSILLLANPWFAAELTGFLSTSGQNHTEISTLIPLWFVLILVQSLVSYVSGVMVANTGQLIKTDLWKRLHRHILHQPVNILEQRKRGDTISYYSNDVAILSSFLTSTLTGIVPQMLTFVGAAILLCITDYKIGIMVLVGILPLIFAAKLLGKNLKAIAKKTFESFGGVYNVIEENLQQIPIIKAFNLEDASLESLDTKLDEYKNNYFKYNHRQFLIMPVIKSLGGGLILAAIWLLSQSIIDNQISIEKLVKLSLYGFLIVRPISTLAGTFGLYQSALAADSRLYQLFHIQQENYQNNSEPTNETISTFTDNLTAGMAVRFEEVDYTYDNVNNVLKGFSLNIEPGETVALTGPNGCGKSTAVKLLMHFMQPTNGKILLNNVNISNLPVDTLRSRIGYVPQTNHMFSGTIRDNLKIGKSAASDSELLECLAGIGANSLVQDLPDGLDTLTGEQGTMLSGGQCQRIALARALLARPPLLILDEATSMFDASAELDYVIACRNWLKYSTVILITHRPASLELASREIQMGL